MERNILEDPTVLEKLVSVSRELPSDTEVVGVVSAHEGKIGDKDVVFARFTPETEREKKERLSEPKVHYLLFRGIIDDNDRATINGRVNSEFVKSREPHKCRRNFFERIKGAILEKTSNQMIQEDSFMKTDRYGRNYYTKEDGTIQFRDELGNFYTQSCDENGNIINEYMITGPGEYLIFQDFEHKTAVDKHGDMYIYNPETSSYELAPTIEDNATKIK